MPSVNYWRGSAPEKGQQQLIDNYPFLKFNVFKLQAVPDFASGRFKKIEHLDPSARVAFIASLQKGLLKGISYFNQIPRESPSKDFSCGYSLRIIFSPNREKGHFSTEIYLISRVAANSNEDVIAIRERQKAYIESLLASQFYRFLYLEDEEAWRPTWFSDLDKTPYCYEVIKSEEVFQWLEKDSKFFYSPGSLQVNRSNDMTALLEQLQAYKHDAYLDITLVPTTITGYEKKGISRYIEALTKAGRGINEEDIDADSNTQKVKSEYENVRNQYYSGIVFLHSFRVFSPCQDTCQNIASLLAASGSANGNYPKIVAADKEYSVQTAISCNINEKTCFQGIWGRTASEENESGFSPPQTLRRLHRLISLDEASAFFRLPIPVNQPCVGLPYDTGAIRFASSNISGTGRKDPARTIKVGTFYRNQPTSEICEFDIERLKTHMLIVGGSGSGKTSTTFNMLCQLWERHKIPFIVFDPKITPEYRYLKKLNSFKEDLLIFTPGQEYLAPFRMNPFEVLSGVPLQEHISRLFDCFVGALPVEDPLPSFIMKALDKAYEEKGWNLSMSRGGFSEKGIPLDVPDMNEFRDYTLEFAARNYGRDREVGDRIKGALDARLYRLTSNSGVAKMFDSISKMPMKELMCKPIIFELGGLNQEEQSLFSLFILAFIFEYIRTERVGNFVAKNGSDERATDLNLKHVLLIEEAHNLLGVESKNGNSNKAGAEVINKVSQMMREMRSAGEGVIIVDQSPSALAQPIVDATSLKMMHRLPSPDDREYVGKAMCLTEGEVQLSGLLSAGQGFYYVPGWDRAQRIDTVNVKEDNLDLKTALQEAFSDEQLVKSFRDDTTRFSWLSDGRSPKEGIENETNLGIDQKLTEEAVIGKIEALTKEEMLLRQNIQKLEEKINTMKASKKYGEEVIEAYKGSAVKLRKEAEKKRVELEDAAKLLVDIPSV